MPLYEYRCSDCGHQFEMLRPMREADEPAVCGSCNNGAQRVLSVFASFSTTDSGAPFPMAGAGVGCGGCSPTGCGCAH